LGIKKIRWTETWRMGLGNGDELSSGGFRALRICGGDLKLMNGRLDKGHWGQRNGRRCGWSRHCRRNFLWGFTQGSSGRFIGGFDGGFFRGTSG
jgi:hypothetical protein